VANQVRLRLFILAYNLGNFLRRLALPEAVRDWSLRSVQVKLIKIGADWCAMPADWCSNWLKWPCHESYSRVYWSASPGCARHLASRRSVRRGGWVGVPGSNALCATGSVAHCGSV
jgi:hypothetical protein